MISDGSTGPIVEIIRKSGEEESESEPVADTAEGADQA